MLVVWYGALVRVSIPDSFVASLYSLGVKEIKTVLTASHYLIDLM